MSDTRSSGDDVTARWEAEHPGWKVETEAPLVEDGPQESRGDFAVTARHAETDERIAGAGADLDAALDDMRRLLHERSLLQ